MSARVYTTDFTIAAGTAIAAPATQAVTLDDEQLDKIQIIIPDGHIGLTGLAISWGGTQVVPYVQGTWIIGNNEIIDYDYGGEITAGGLTLRGYNLGVYSHTFHIRWYMSLLSQAPPLAIVSPQQTAPAAPADIAAILGITGVVA